MPWFNTQKHCKWVLIESWAPLLARARGSEILNYLPPHLFHPAFRCLSHFSTPWERHRLQRRLCKALGSMTACLKSSLCCKTEWEQQSFFWHSLPQQLREHTTFLSEVMFPGRQKTFSNAVHLKHFQGTAHRVSLQNKNVIVWRETFDVWLKFHSPE